MSSILPVAGVLLSLVGTLIAGVVGLFGQKQFFHRLSQLILLVSLCAGALAGILTLVGERVLLLGHIPFFFGATVGLDTLSSLFFTVVCLVGALCALYAMGYLERYKTIYHLPSLQIATCLFLFGMQAVTLLSNAVGFLFFWEMMSIASFFLVLADREEASMRAAFLYLVMTHLGAGAILGGFFLLGNGNLFVDFSVMSVMAQALPAWKIALAFGLLFFGFGSKAGLVPFHVWLPEAHPQAPSHISALMSGVMLKIAVYGWLRVLLTVFPTLPAVYGAIVVAFGLLSLLFGVLYAVVDRDIKRTLAFSSIENLGLIFTMIGVSMVFHAKGITVAANLTLLAALLHVLNHAIFKSGLFLTAGAIVSETHTRNLEQMGGLAKRLPALTGAFCLLALGASALPPFGAFFAEWTFLQTILSAFVSIGPLARVLLAGIFATVVFGSGLAIFAMVKLFAIASLGEPRSAHAARAKSLPATIITPLWIFALLALLTGAFVPVLAVLLIGGSSFSFGLLVSPLPVPSASLRPLLVTLGLGVTLLVAWVLRRMFSDSRQERLYHTWDCGQPITPGMEYTATAFSGPIRFFFRFLLRTRKRVHVQPVVGTNPWIARRTMTLELRSIWMEYVYAPLAAAVLWIAAKVRLLQNGNIQFYLVLMFGALIASLLIAL
jgi:hydrogenase-4 component B